VKNRMQFSQPNSTTALRRNIQWQPESAAWCVGNLPFRALVVSCEYAYSNL